MPLSSLQPFLRLPLSAVLASVLLASCGGGDGNSSPTPTPPPPANVGPSFTSSSTVDIPENSKGTIYTATANDPDGDNLTFSISGGADAGLFSISSGGNISFVQSPDFESPGDANGDNSYEITIAVSDGSASESLNLSVRVTNLADAMRLTRVATIAGQPVSLVATAESDLLVAANSDGVVFEITPASGATSEIGRIFDAYLSAPNYRLLSMAPSGNYATNREIFAIFVREANGFVDIDQFAKAQAIWTNNTAGIRGEAISQSIAANLQAAGFLAPDGSVYFAIGDGGDPDRAAQDALVGNLVRVRDNPNPYSGASVVFFLADTVGRGLHEPTGGSFVQDTLLFSDSGATQFDEINRFSLGSGILDYGWPFREGRTTVRNGAPTDIIDPVFVFDRDGADAGSSKIVAGQYYEGPVGELNERYVFATQDGRFFTIALSDLEAGDLSTLDQAIKVENESQPDAGSLDQVVAIASASGSIFILDADGEIFRVDEAG